MEDVIINSVSRNLNSDFQNIEISSKEFVKDPEFTPEIDCQHSPKFSFGNLPPSIMSPEIEELITQMPDADAHYRKNTAQSIKDIEMSCDLFVSKSMDSSLAQTAEFTKQDEMFEIETPQTNYQTYDNTIQESASLSEHRIKEASQKITLRNLGQFRSLKDPTESDKAVGMGLMTLFQEVQNLGSILSWMSVTLWLRKLDPVIVHIRSMVRMVKQKKITVNIINKVKKRIQKVNPNNLSPISQPIWEIILATLEYYTNLRSNLKSVNRSCSAIPRSRPKLRCPGTSTSIKQHFDSIAVSPVKRLIQKPPKVTELDDFKFIDTDILKNDNTDTNLLQLLVDQTRRQVQTLTAEQSKHKWEEVRTLKRQNSQSEQKLLEKERDYEKAEAKRQAKLVITKQQQEVLQEKVERQRKIEDAKAVDERRKAEIQAKRQDDLARSKERSKLLNQKRPRTVTPPYRSKPIPSQILRTFDNEQQFDKRGKTDQARWEIKQLSREKKKLMQSIEKFYRF